MNTGELTQVQAALVADFKADGLGVHLHDNQICTTDDNGEQVWYDGDGVPQ